jgi:hypothetical protein
MENKEIVKAFNITPSDNEKLRTYAEKKNMRVSEFIRWALNLAFRKVERDY